MTSQTSNNSSPRSDAGPMDGVPSGPDAHGQAAMLLVESLIHTLIARSVISVADAVEIVTTAAEIKEEVAASLGDSPATMRKSLALLEAIANSLRLDITP